jgi:hypothetical protein
MNKQIKEDIQELIRCIEKARQVARKIDDDLGGLESCGRPLILPSLELAYRDALYVSKMKGIRLRKPPVTRTRRRLLRNPIHERVQIE